MSASAGHTSRRLATRRRHVETEEAQYRYLLVFLLVLGAVMFVIIAPDGNLSRAVSFAIVGTTFLVAVLTSQVRSTVRRRRAIYGGVVIAIVTIGTATAVLPRSISFAIGVLVTLAVPATLAGGLLKLVREQGVTLQAVAGALAIYLLVGLAFASAVGFVSEVSSNQFFAEAASTNASQRVYYSFTVLTTTGFGDLTAARGVGRALAVLEMLTGTIYLVTVIGILIGRRVETGDLGRQKGSIDTQD